MNLLAAARIVGVSCPSFTIGESPCCLTRQELRRFCVVQPWRPVPMVLELRCVGTFEKICCKSSGVSQMKCEKKVVFAKEQII